MTMADQIAVMNRGRIEQLGAPTDLYERPATAFVAGFLGVSNLLAGVVAGEDRVRLDDGTEVRLPLGGRSGRVAVGVRPEKVRLAAGGVNELPGTVTETAYVGVATQVIVTTPAGIVSVFAQNTESGALPPAAGSHVTLSWSPESTFVVDRTEKETP